MLARAFRPDKLAIRTTGRARLPKQARVVWTGNLAAVIDPGHLQRSSPGAAPTLGSLLVQEALRKPSWHGARVQHDLLCSDLDGQSTSVEVDGSPPRLHPRVCDLRLARQKPWSSQVSLG